VDDSKGGKGQRRRLDLKKIPRMGHKLECLTSYKRNLAAGVSSSDAKKPCLEITDVARVGEGATQKLAPKDR
ncbi:hypothetical protein PIB30_077797, partial [Stylosanthes scabra]|nr:hypothetical protein [Stylosanthes scabra]